MPLPACCIPTPTASRAERLFCAYNNSGPIERRGLTDDNKEVPSWAVLRERAASGDVGSAAVIEKWESVGDACLEPPEIGVPDGYVADLIAALAAHGWVAEWEPAQPEEDPDPIRFVNGPLILSWMTFDLSRHRGLGLFIHGLSGEFTAVDCVDTPAAEVPGKIAEFARSCLERDLAYMTAGFEAAKRLTP